MRRLIFVSSLVPAIVAACSPAPLGGVKGVSAGTSHTCAVLKDGRVMCWGADDQGQLGNGDTAPAANPVPVAGMSDAVAVSSGQMHTCAVLKGGRVKCWGANTYGQLGDGTGNAATTPVEVKGLPNTTAVAAGWSHTCALLDDGTVKCWGLNGSAQLGAGVTEGPQSCHGPAGDFSCSLTPVEVKGLSGVKAISAGGNHTCALGRDGTVGCWGANTHAQLGLGTSTGPDTCTIADWQHACAATVQVTKKIADVVAIAAGGYHTCALLGDTSVRCWGPNLMGQLATGQQRGSWTPVLTRDLDGAVALSAGLMHNCAVLKDGHARCWGNNNRGQLGAVTGRESGDPQHGDEIRSTVPVPVVGLGGAAAISCGGEHTCALTNGGTVACWGSNENGRLGGNVKGPFSRAPVTVRVAKPGR